MIRLIQIYRYFVSPILHALAGPTMGCRFEPTCSHYAADAFKSHPPLRAVKWTIWRLLRCHPFSKGGHDPVPVNSDFSHSGVFRHGS